ncbi:hypothetical protein V8G54_000536 [Vigna mungo]|uniref:SWIM-type domain-containing protein n=1 Tax=Vigna mungo TaxID=3915 RepID=A0AAQ3S921_VIGMU
MWDLSSISCDWFLASNHVLFCSAGALTCWLYNGPLTNLRQTLQCQCHYPRCSMATERYGIREFEFGDFLKCLREEVRDIDAFHCWRRRSQSRLLVTRIEVIKESFIMAEERIKIVVHHSGRFCTDDNGVFKFDGEIAEWSVDADLLSYFGIVASVNELGHMDIKELWYGLGGQSVHPDRLELLTDDKGAMHMLNIGRLNDEAHLYVVHNMVEPQIIEFIDWVGGEEGYGVDVEVQTEGDGQEGGEVQGGEVEDEVQVEDADGDEVQDDDDQVEAANVDQVEDGEDLHEVQVEVQGNLHHVQEPEVHEVDDFEVEDLGEDDEEEDSEGEEFHDNESEEEDLYDVTVQCDNGRYKGNVREQHESRVLDSSESSDNENNMDGVRGLSDNEWLSDELISDVEDNEVEEDGGSSKKKTTFPTFTMPRSMDGYKWEVGTFFAEKKEFMDGIRTYALSNGRNMKFVKNDKKRIIVKCLGGQGKCNWYAYCAFRIDVNAWQLRKVVDSHICSRDFNVKLMTSKWLSERMEKSVRENPTMKVMDIRDKVTRKWNVGISRNMAFRARAMAKDKIEGSFHEQYRRLYDYGHELLKTNPGSTVQIKVDNINGEVIFQRFYVCLKACKDSFVSCRPIVGLDGCFLKTKYGGELLTAVGRDGNEQMLPITYVVVEVENTETWTWFLQLLIEDLGGKDVCAGITFMSDQQKGLLASFQHLLPGVEQRFCVRHLYSNFRKTFPGKDLKRLMWRAAVATHPQQWEAEMRNIKAINDEAFKYLLSIPPRYWSRSRFTPRSQCDTLVNNMSEAFNSVLVDSRSKPIISMLEDIRVYIMKRWAANKTKMTQYQASICPKVWNRFQKESSLVRYWLPRWSREKLFEVMHISQFGNQFVVNVDTMDCTCRKWAITGIPCVHTITSMKFLNINAEDYITHWFRKSTYEETYNSIIYPINGQHIWEVTPYSNILPPKKKKMPGRPKKKRRLEEWELKKNDSELRKGGQRKKCGICKELGHNKKGCPQRPTAQSPSEQTQGTQGPPIDVPLTQESTVMATASGPPQQPDSIVNDAC